MRIVYSLPHPADRLDSQRAGHTIRASALLAAFEALGHEVVRVEAAREQKTQTAVTAYRHWVKKLLPRSVALKLRDAGRVLYGRRYAHRLVEVIGQARPDAILETHIAFSLAGKIASRRTGLPFILDDVAPHWEEEQQYSVGLRQIARQVYREVTGHASMLIAVNSSIRQHLLQDGLQPDKIVVIENGIDADLFRPNSGDGRIRAKYGIDQQATVIIFVGSFQPYHKVELLLQAFSQLDTNLLVHLLLVGEGQLTPECRTLAAKLGLLDTVTFAGRVPYDEVSAFIADSDIAIMPATNDYGNPMKVYEYMAIGKAVLAPNQRTITELVTHRQDALLFEPDSVQAMAAALQTAIDDPILRHHLGRKASASAASFTWERRAELLQEMIYKAGIVQPSALSSLGTPITLAAKRGKVSR